MLLTAQHIHFQLPPNRVLFDDLHFTLDKNDHAAITGDNGAGKSTLLKILAGILAPQSGTIIRNAPLYYVPQHFGQFNDRTVAQVLGIDAKIHALQAILNGDTQESHFDVLGDDWDIMERCEQLFARWNIAHIPLTTAFSQLSGGEKTRTFLAGSDLVAPAAILLDEPTNHLDKTARAQLYEWVDRSSKALLVVSHDRQLLELCHPIWELSNARMQVYGGNYSFYESKKAEEKAALQQQIAHAEKTLKEARAAQQQAFEKQQRENARGNKSRKEGGLPKILMNGRRDQAAKTTARQQEAHAEKVAGLQATLDAASSNDQVARIMKGHFATPPGHKGKILVQAEKLNYAHPGNEPLWPQPLDFIIKSGDRLAIAGNNGSGKSTLIKLITGKLPPQQGRLYVASFSSLVLDQDYSDIDRSKTVWQQAADNNEIKLPEGALNTMLVRFLFGPDTWSKSCSALSGGETLRLALCCMTLRSQSPDMIILDEPTNNLDLTNIQMLTQIFAAYQGTLVVVSHDARFLSETGVTETLQL
ncbi:ABC-F family ATP-binding cassette domain-containing protein [Chitinophaga qingshengii]|uniref:ABC-F family ATP-binding cassette domain-containing protein n=1 Tax=Chitinophaga qingshengii TaxID=1569794 RepID=A0ABR7TGC5_9BACT|nr:ABC-F family ATP-binding cassette domain-containing protein [Chitinophaga qingshengii]MBC9929492.1 ABC-F family ATP-binding cassette domain-containing protein [Chitinophaga qingshengii]